MKKVWQSSTVPCLWLESQLCILKSMLSSASFILTGSPVSWWPMHNSLRKSGNAITKRSSLVWLWFSPSFLNTHYISQKVSAWVFSLVSSFKSRKQIENWKTFQAGLFEFFWIKHHLTSLLNWTWFAVVEQEKTKVCSQVFVFFEHHKYYNLFDNIHYMKVLLNLAPEAVMSW